jgi:tripartite-type tricarboxylate transporter receptor subunit TctC
VSSLGPFVIAPHLIKNVPYDMAKDFDLLTVAVQAPNVLVVPAASPYKSVADVLAASKKTPGKLTFASSATARRITSRPSCSGRRPAPAACTCRTRAARRR